MTEWAAYLAGMIVTALTPVLFRFFLPLHGCLILMFCPLISVAVSCVTIKIVDPTFYFGSTFGIGIMFQLVLGVLWGLIGLMIGEFIHRRLQTKNEPSQGRRL